MGARSNINLSKRFHSPVEPIKSHVIDPLWLLLFFFLCNRSVGGGRGSRVEHHNGGKKYSGIKESFQAKVHRQSRTKGRRQKEIKEVRRTRARHVTPPSARWSVSAVKHTHTRARTCVSHTLLCAHTSHTRVLKHTLRASYLVALWLRWHRFCSGSCYKTTLSVCVAADSPGFGATGGTRRHFYLGFIGFVISS